MTLTATEKPGLHGQVLQSEQRVEEGEEKEKKETAAERGENLHRDGFYGKYHGIQRSLLLATSVHSQGAAGRAGRWMGWG